MFAELGQEIGVASLYSATTTAKTFREQLLLYLNLGLDAQLYKWVAAEQQRGGGIGGKWGAWLAKGLTCAFRVWPFSSSRLMLSHGRRQHSVGNEPLHMRTNRYMRVQSVSTMASSADLVLGLAGKWSPAQAECSLSCAAPPKCCAKSPLLCCQSLPLPWQAPPLPCLSVHKHFSLLA